MLDQAQSLCMPLFEKHCDAEPPILAVTFANFWGELFRNDAYYLSKQTSVIQYESYCHVKLLKVNVFWYKMTFDTFNLNDLSLFKWTKLVTLEIR